MAALGTLSGTASAVDSINDLDGYTFRDYSFPSATAFAPTQEDDFGFDPAPIKPTTSLNNFQPYSPPTDLSLSEWPDFQRDDDMKPSLGDSPLSFAPFEADGFVKAGLPNSSTAVSRYGQMTPPRSNSAASSDSLKLEEKHSPKSTAPEPRRKRASKAQPKEDDSVLASTTATSGRKRKSSKKSGADKGASPEEQKRKQSLEKNRLAAAKCRMNKKEKTEQLQRDSHDKAVQNAYLKDQIMRMKDEIQQMNALLLAHANCEECKAPEEIQAHLAHLGSDFFTTHMGFGNTNFGDFSSQMNFPELPAMDNDYFDQSHSQMQAHPPLPEFNRSADFEVQTPMQLD
ncbi:uncharacterized protein PV06_07351 [Exophiala oligosperma]|uniref:BZIP domain-containing protein n=1 Tax=Exophiala oligosperma TaxID=215243 RepID=A0A0D2DAJ0_9EURO|nr:uncharacterized protein PV06_07351 [Exophiala oligosperma]KIW40123.1 hypothetical protein PV06_07351 [Exophiala oligosperma]